MGNKKVRHNRTVIHACHDYSKYRIAGEAEHIDQIEVESLNQDEFYERYVKFRKPVKFTNCIKEIDIGDFRIDKLEELLGYDGRLKVEKRYKGGFGTNFERINMGLRELVEIFDKGEADYYLTTQYDDDESDDESEEKNEEDESDDEPEEKNEEDEKDVGDTDEEDCENEYEHDQATEPLFQDEDGADSDSSFGSIDMNNLQDDFQDSDDEMCQKEIWARIRQLFQPPLTNLYDKLPLTPSLLSMLIPQQINIWMGYSKPIQPPQKLGDLSSKYIPGNGSSSGLHHDHADNLYILVSGSKRFTLYSPSDADKLSTVGNIYKVYNSGVIDYHRDEKAPNWNHVREDGAMVREVAKWQLSHKDADPEAKKKLLTIINEQETKFDHKPINPPSFSNIPPVLLHLDELNAHDRLDLVKFSNTHFPGFLDTPKLTVWLKPGEMLYLPTGWFHEVSSFGSDTVTKNRDNVHIALNYWFLPPSGDSLSGVYQDSYWSDDFEKSKQAVDLATKGSVTFD